MKRNDTGLISRSLISAALLLVVLAAGACSTTMNLPGEQIAETELVYFVPLQKIPYMIYLSAQEPKERSRSFSLADSVTATGTLLYPGTIDKINRQAFEYYKKIFGSRIVWLPPHLRVKKRSLLGTSYKYDYNKFKADFFIHLTFKEKNRQVQAKYTIRGLDFLKEALPVYPEGSPMLISMYMRSRENRKFRQVYRKELHLFNKLPEKKESLEPLNEAFVWHISYASAETAMRRDFMKHVTILRAAVLERINAFFEESAGDLEKALP